MSTTSLKNIYNEVSAKYSPAFKASMKTFWTTFKENFKQTYQSGKNVSKDTPSTTAEIKEEFNPIKNAIDGFKQKVSNFFKNTSIAKKIDRVKQASSMKESVVSNIESNGPQFGE